MAIDFCAALAGGLVAAAISRSAKPMLVLAGLGLGLGLGMPKTTVLATDQGQPPLRGPEVGILEAMQNSRQPPFIAVLNPLVGAAGVLLAARLMGRRANAARI
jgi:hypothetical protein